MECLLSLYKRARVLHYNLVKILTKEQSTFDKHGNHEIIVLEPAVVPSAASVIGAEHHQSVVSDMPEFSITSKICPICAHKK